MKRFAFRLERVLRVREVQERAQKSKLAVEVGQQREQTRLLDEAQHLSLELARRYAGLGRQGSLQPLVFRRFQSYQNVLEWAVRDQRLVLGEQLKKVDAAREALKQARCQTQIYEKMKSRSREAWKRDMEREVGKNVDEISGTKAARRERGSMSQIAMAVFAAFFLALLIFVVTLFFLGHLTGPKLRLIANVLGYKAKDYEGKERHYSLVVGEQAPYVMHSATLHSLMKIHDAYDRLLAADVDDENVLTKPVQDKNREILDRVGGLILRHAELAGNALKDVDLREQDIAMRERALKEGFEKLDKAVAQKQQEQFLKAQDDILKTMKSQDPEDIARTLTAGKKFEDFGATLRDQRDLKEAVSRIASYLTRMSQRQRAGVQEALGPMWMSAVNRHIERPGE